MRYVIVWVSLCPGLKCINCFVTVAGYIAMVLFRDVILFALAYPIAQVISLLTVFHCQFCLTPVVIGDGESCIGKRKVRVDFNGTLVNRNSFQIVALRSQIVSLGERLEGLE